MKCSHCGATDQFKTTDGVAIGGRPPRSITYCEECGEVDV